MIRILLVDDHASFRGAFALVFESEPDMTVVAEAGSVAEARRFLAGEHPDVDVAVLDFDLPDGSGEELIGDLRDRNPHAEALLLSGVADETQFALAVEAGASGVLHKTAPTIQVVEAIRRLAAGEQLLSPEEILRMIRLAGRHRQEEREARTLVDQLTTREREVLQALADGLGDRELAARLGISVRTARNHMTSILAKLHVRSRLQALVFAVRNDVVRIKDAPAKQPVRSPGLSGPAPGHSRASG